MLSRIADSLFWLGRYIERAEDTARILDVTFHTLLEQAQQPHGLRWDHILSMAGEESLFRHLYGEANARNVFEFLAFHSSNPSSILQCVTQARENARTMRDRISREMWEDLNSLYFTLGRFDPQEETAAGPHRFCTRVIFGCHRFHGVSDATLPHDEGWEFLRRLGARASRNDGASGRRAIPHSAGPVSRRGATRQPPMDGCSQVGGRL